MIRGLTTLLLALWVTQPGAALATGTDQASTAVWTELAPAPAPSADPDGATWISAPSASLLELQLEPGVAAEVWRVEVDHSGNVRSSVELIPEALGDGRHLLWTGPAPRAYLAIAPAAGAVQVWLLEPVDDGAAVSRIERRLWRWAASAGEPLPALPAADGSAALVGDLAGRAAGGQTDPATLRRALLGRRLLLFDPPTPHLSLGKRPGSPGEQLVDDGGTTGLSTRGPGLLVLDATPTLASGPGPVAVHLDLSVEDEASRPLARLPTGGVAWPNDPAGSRAPRRTLELPAPPGDRELLARIDGATILLRARLYRVRPRFPDLPDALRWRALGRRIGDTTTSDRGSRPAQDALAEGRFEDAQDLALDILATDPGDLAALKILGSAQARVPAIGDVPALPSLEAAVRGQDLAGPGPAHDDTRQALRDTWLHATAYLTRGIRAPGPRGEVVQALPPRNALAEPDDEGRHRPSVYSFLPPGEPISVALDEGSDPALWTVVQGIGLNLSGRPAAASLQVDDHAAERVVLAGPVTRFRIALAPGAHRIMLSLPQGHEERIAVATDLPLAAEVAGRWDGDHPHLRTAQATPIAPGGGDATFGLPSAAVGPTHLRVEAWWVGDEPQDLVLESAEGLRRIRIHPVAAPPAVLMSDGDAVPGTPLATSEATVDLGIDAEWVRLRRDGGNSPLWARVAIRGPRHHAISPEDRGTPPAVEPAPADLERLSAALAIATDPVERAGLHAARAELLLGLNLPGYARRDIDQARRAGDTSAGLERLEAAARSVGGPHRPRVHTPPRGPLLPLDVPAAAGPGEAAWLGDLPADDPACLIAEGELDKALAVSPHDAAIHAALAAKSLDWATEDPEAALLALLHASAARAVVEDAETARIAQRATLATRPDHLGTAEESPDRILLGGPIPPPDPQADPARWARWTMLGAPLPHVDQLLAAGTRWVIQPDGGAPSELSLEVVCDDLRQPREGDGTLCHLTIAQGEAEPETWAVPTGRVERRPLSLPADSSLAISLAHEGHARYAALALVGPDEGWRIADRRAWFHVAQPEERVCYQVAGPTRLLIEATPRSGAGPIRLEVLDGETPLLSREWSSVPRAMITDQDVAYGAVDSAPIDLFATGPRDLVLRTGGGAVAVRVTRRVASEVVLPPPPASVDAGIPADPGTERPVEPAVSEGALRLPRPAAGGTLDASVSFWDRWSADLEKSDQRYQYVQVDALHRLGLRRSGNTWFHGGGMARIGFTAGPSFGLRLGAYHRWPAAGLRLGGKAQGLIQATDQGTFGALALRARLDRPTRLAPDLTLVPHLQLRGHVQPRIELQWFARRLDMELASSYRRAHPVGLGVGTDLVWRPWVDGAFVLTVGAMTNPELPILDNAGGQLEFRLYPRPVGLGARVHLSHRFADSWRPEGWWRAELAVGAWADLGPPDLWVRPAVQLSYLLDPARLEATVGLSITPGRRAATHFAPTDLRFGDLRAPVAIDGRWTRF